MLEHTKREKKRRQLSVKGLDFRSRVIQKAELQLPEHVRRCLIDKLIYQACDAVGSAWVNVIEQGRLPAFLIVYQPVVV